MQQSKLQSKEKKVERRKQWCDRRSLVDRRNPERLDQAEYDCRSYASRRESDIAGSLAEGEVWWSGDRRFV
jgi:hypothetical protein